MHWRKNDMGDPLNERIKKSIYNADGTTDPRLSIFWMESDDTIIQSKKNDGQIIIIFGLGEKWINAKHDIDAALEMENADTIPPLADGYADGGAENDCIYAHQDNGGLFAMLKNSAWTESRRSGRTGRPNQNNFYIPAWAAAPHRATRAWLNSGKLLGSQSINVFLSSQWITN